VEIKEMKQNKLFPSHRRVHFTELNQVAVMGRCRYFWTSNTSISYKSLVIQPHTPGGGQKEELYLSTPNFSDLFSIFNSSQLFPFPS